MADIVASVVSPQGVNSNIPTGNVEAHSPTTPSVSSSGELELVHAEGSRPGSPKRMDQGAQPYYDHLSDAKAPVFNATVRPAAFYGEGMLMKDPLYVSATSLPIGMPVGSHYQQPTQWVQQPMGGPGYLGPLSTTSPSVVSAATHLPPGTIGGVSRFTSSAPSTWLPSRLHSTGTRSGRPWMMNATDFNVEEAIARGDLVITGERIVDRPVKIAKKVLKEVIEEEVQVVREKVVDVAMKTVTRDIEVPELEYVEKIVEVPEKIIKENIVEVPVYKQQERIIEVPTVITQERVIEVPEIEYKEVLVEKIVEVPHFEEKVEIREVPVPRYVEVPFPQYVDVEEKFNVERSIPVPVEAEMTWNLGLKKLRPRFSVVKIPLYVPRFVEVPMPKILLGESEAQAALMAEHVASIAQQPAISLCEVENIAAAIKDADFNKGLASVSYLDTVKQIWSDRTLGADRLAFAAATSPRAAGYSLSRAAAAQPPIVLPTHRNEPSHPRPLQPSGTRGYPTGTITTHPAPHHFHHHPRTAPASRVVQTRSSDLEAPRRASKSDGHKPHSASPSRRHSHRHIPSNRKGSAVVAH